jgi:glycosyltransferase involved in cell wall biosynthesis
VSREGEETSVEDPATTIAIVPHEKFSLTRQNLESVLSGTPKPYRLVVVDGGSPRKVARYLDVQARAHDFALIRTEHFLRPNEARNLALAYVDTEFVAFLDNDVVVDPGWLTPIEQCARETGAAVVSPLCCIGPVVHARIHLTVGECRIIEKDGRRTMHEHFVDSQAPFDKVLARVERAQCELVDSHAFLVRSDALGGGAWFDEQVRLEEHVDMSLTISGAGGTLWLEPRSIVSYLTTRLQPSDLPYYVAVLGEAEGRRGLAHLTAKWRLSPDDPWIGEKLDWAGVLRRRGYKPYRSPFTRILRRYGREPRQIVDRLAQRIAEPYYDRSRARGTGARLVHAASWIDEDQRLRGRVS